MSFNFQQAEGIRNLSDAELIEYIRNKFPVKYAMYDYLVNYGMEHNTTILLCDS